MTKTTRATTGATTVATNALTNGAGAERRKFGHLRQLGGTWWVRYRVDGVEKWENLKTKNRRKAEDAAAVIGDRVGKGEHTPSAARRLTFADLADAVRTDYTLAANRSHARLENALVHLLDAFGATRAVSITAERVAAYEVARLAAGAARATVNYELSIVRRAFRLALRQRRLHTMPSIVIRAAKNARVGFFEPDDFTAVLAELPAYLRPVMTFAYLTGWRVRSEVLPLTWDRVDLDAGVIRLDPNTTKNAEGRVIPFAALPALDALIRSQHAATQALERERGAITPCVFHRNGAPIEGYKRAWTLACDRAAHGGVTATDGAPRVVVRPALLTAIVHDFRRTAVRNLVRAGVPDGVAMRITGHKTRSVFERYNITNDADLRAGFAKLDAHLNPPAKPTPEAKPNAKPKAPKKSARGKEGGILPLERVGGAA
jgi:integrase